MRMKIVCCNCKAKVFWSSKAGCWVHKATLVVECVFRTRPVASPEVLVPGPRKKARKK